MSPFLIFISYSFCEVTQHSDDGYPVYKRPNNGKHGFKGNIRVDNRFVVPYNAWALDKYDCHINFEIASSVASVKYLYKYITKGVDRAAVGIDNGDIDEIQNYLDCRYISPVEACWKILDFPVVYRTHAVVRLPVHLEDQQVVNFPEDADVGIYIYYIYIGNLKYST